MVDFEEPTKNFSFDNVDTAVYHAVDIGHDFW